MFADSAARQLDRTLRHDVRTTGKRPRDAFTDMMASIPKRFKASDVQAEVIAKVPAFREVKRQLNRHRSERCVPIPDPLNIPETLRTTLRGRDAADDDPLKGERFLRYTGQNGMCCFVICSISKYYVAQLLRVILWSPYGIRETIYIFMLWFVLSSSFFSSPNLSRRRLDVCHTSAHGVALVRI